MILQRPNMLAVVLGVLPLCLTACDSTPPVYDNPLAVMLDREKIATNRIAAAEQARAASPDDPQRIRNLNKLVWDRGHPFALRKVAIDHLIEHDEAEFRTNLARRIVLINNWETLEYLLGLGVERRWPNFDAVAVRSYARLSRTMPDAERPERAALLKLHPDRELQDIVFDVFARQDEAIDVRQQVAAWELLNRISDSETLIAHLNAAPDTNPMVVDLKAAARDLHALPRTREGVLRLSYIRDPRRADFWAKAKARVAQLGDAQKVGLELRHMPALIALGDDVLAMSRAALVSDLHVRLSAAEHHLKGPSYDGGASDHPQLLRLSLDRLVWADLATVHLLTGLLNDRDAVAALFQHADQDHEDRTTEFGGVLGYDTDRRKFTVTPYTPLMRRHDLTFIPSQQMIEHVYTSVAHYHFHAREYKHSEWAGPGQGDLRMADRIEVTAIVLTFIDRDRLNLDYYQPGKVVVDVGTMRR